jgi:branched-chain amino acid aminotransferase
MVLHRFFIQNGLVSEAAEFKPHTGIEIYEVVRVIGGIPLFLEDHFKRFFHSAWLCHLEIPLEEEEISAMLKMLIKVNGVENGNIRFAYCFRPTGDFQAYFIPHHYPDPRQVQEGVVCGILSAERFHPNAKVVQSNLREIADGLIAEKGWYEVLLVNQNGLFTEGSRSNLFFFRKGIFITSPSEDVLPGITRNKVIQILKSNKKEVIETDFLLSELDSADAAFLTGTSPKVIPVKQIGETSFRTDFPEIRRLIKAYDQFIQAYIEKHQSDHPRI